MDVRVVDHPLAAARLTTLRDERTDNAAFRAALRDLTLMLVFEATRDAERARTTIRTPLAETTGTRLANPPLLVPVLRAGLGMVDQAHTLIPEARVGFVGVARDEETHEPTPYLESLPADLSTIEGIDALVEKLADVPSIDVLVNNAGASWGASIEEFPEVGWDKVMDTNVKGVFFLTQRLLSKLEEGATAEDPARIINIGSIDGIRSPTFDTWSYGASKAALHALTRQMGNRLVKRNVIANAIAPGPFPTWMLSTGVGTGGDVEGTDWEALGRTVPRGRVGTPEDVAGTAIFLASRAGAYVVGEVIALDGGIVVS